jgi:NADH-quinone oxidoreductase subunit M
MNGFPWISVLTLTPLAGAFLLLLLPRQKRNVARILAVASSTLALALTLWLWRIFNSASGALQFQERHGWIPSLNVEYHVAIDGLGLLMLLLSAIVVLMSIAASTKSRAHSTLPSCCSSKPVSSAPSPR